MRTMEAWLWRCAAAIAAVVYGGRPLETIEWSGDGALAARFVTLFPLPEKVP